ncbi:phosphomevalonate kinase [Micromonospora chalcea]|uniref:phosphomevalonate kinase n=1 Tax=Micromonospora chalcea TaxID=1874 RepID=UPI0033D1EA31
MTGPGAVRHHAPGKLFIAGEYAVLEPGHPALLVAVDRGVDVTVSGADAHLVVDSDLRPDRARLRWQDGRLVAADDGQPAPADLGAVTSAIEVVGELLAGRGLRPLPMRVAITSRLHRAGTKFGLGSSGAVSVATVTAVAAYHGVELSLESRFRLAMLATVRDGADASGGDLAASVWGGWIAYQAPDRAAVRDMARRRGVEETMRAPWPGLRVRRLPPPRGLALEVGWTGEPASSSALTGRLAASRWRGSAARWSFTSRSQECVRTAIDALERGDDQELLHQVRRARHVLAELDDEVRLGIFTPRLTALCDAAETVGGAAKPSGAGGGDCGIALLDAAAATQTARLREQWAAAGVLPMPIQVHQTNGSAR